MESLQIAICEDSIEAQDRILYILENSNFPVNITVFDCGEKLLENYNEGKFDLIFMDIYMPGISGVETITQIRRVDDSIPVAFTTTSTDHTLESYRLNALKYIEKPIKERAVYELLELAQLRKKNAPHLTLKIRGKEVAVQFEKIVHIEQKSHNIFLLLTGGEIIKANEKLEHIEAQFEDLHFFRCHKSFLVNLSYVKNIDRELMVFIMKEGKNVHIRRESMVIARKAFETYLFKMSRSILK
ncbi:MAG: LytR/AlgR family response regulator transcription factor [Proteocatella sp.]